MLLASLVSLSTAGCNSRHAGRGGPISWERVPFATLCGERSVVSWPTKSGGGFPASLDRVRPLGPHRLAMVDRENGRVVLFDSAGRILDAVGRTGDGPGEFRFPADVVALSDSSLAIVDPVSMRVTLLSPQGAFRSVFPTSGFAGRRAAALPGGRLALAGLNRAGRGYKLLAVYGPQGDLERYAFEAPQLLVSLTPRIDDAVVGATSDGTVYLVPAALPKLFVLEPEKELVVDLRLPADLWHQLEPPRVAPQTLEDVRTWVEAGSVLTGGGLFGDSLLALGWRTGRDRFEQWHLGLLSLHLEKGLLLTHLPGPLLGINSQTVWLLRRQTAEANLLALYGCKLGGAL